MILLLGYVHGLRRSFKAGVIVMEILKAYSQKINCLQTSAYIGLPELCIPLCGFTTKTANNLCTFPGMILCMFLLVLRGFLKKSLSRHESLLKEVTTFSI